MSRTRRLLVACPLLLLAACHGKVTMTTYTQPAGRFSVLVPEPGTMSYATRPMRYMGADVQLECYVAEQDGVTYTVNYFDIPADVNADLLRQRANFSAIPGLLAMIDENHWSAGETRLARVVGPGGVGIYGRRFEATTDKQILAVQVVWHSNRMYQVIMARPVQPSYQQQVNGDKFVDSFKLI